MSERTHYARLFLNNEEHGGIALIEATVGEIGSHGHFDASLKISDCNRIVDLNFDAYSVDQADEVRQKLARLRRTIVTFEKVVLAQLENVRDR